MGPLQHLWWWIEIHTGTVQESGPYYGFFSGFGSDLGEVALIGGIVALVRHHNCHNHGCWRLGKHTTPDGYKLCKKCVAKPCVDLNLHPIHSDHQW